MVRVYINQHTKNKFELRKMNFMLSVEKSGDCWKWIGCKDKDGYGKCGMFEETRAHRVSYRLFIGKFDRGRCVLHKCDNPICVNPSHLFLGTHQDNIADKVRKGRVAKGDRHAFYLHPEMIMKGEKHPRSKVTEEQVLLIRKLHDGSKGIGVKLSKKFKLSQQQICCIVKRRGWKHI